LKLTQVVPNKQDIQASFLNTMKVNGWMGIRANVITTFNVWRKASWMFC